MANAKKRLVALFVLLALALGALCTLCACSQNQELKFGTGNTEGLYYQFGTILADESQNDADVPTISVETTAGSSANLRLLSQDFLDMAIVQADTLHDAYNGTGFFSNSGAYTGYSAIASVYTEACQIVVPADSPIKSIEDLAGKKVSLGERESGVLQNALQILDAYNLQEGDFTPEYLSFSESAQAMREGKLDAAFMTAAYPTPAITHLADSIGVRVLSVDPFAIDVLTKRHSYYIPCTIPADTYKGQSEAAQTIGVRAVIVARNDMPNEQVEGVMDLLFSDQTPFSGQYSSMRPVLDEATSGVPIAFHPGAAEYYAANNIDVEAMDTKDEGTAVNGSQDD